MHKYGRAARGAEPSGGALDFGRAAAGGDFRRGRFPRFASRKNQSAVCVGAGWLVSSRQERGVCPSSSLTIEMQPGEGQTR